MAGLPPIESSAVWHPYTAVPPPGPRVLITRAEGAYVYDAQGNRYFDATSSWWSQIHGHCHPALVEALSKQAATLDQILLSPHTHPAAQDFAEALLRKMGAPYSKVFWSDDGSTAVEAALKMALQYWQRRGEPERRAFLSMERAYHGDTLGAIAVGHIDEFHRVFKNVLETHKSTAPYCYRCPLGLQYPRCEIACLNRAREVFEKHASTLAACIVEPLMLGAGGLITYPVEYLDGLMELCRQHRVPMIFDEVATGFGRTGTMFAFEQTRGRPDIVCLSKGLTSGMMALGATVTTQEIFQEFCGGESVKFFHGHTFTGNGLACAVGLRSLELFDSNQVLCRNQDLVQEMAAQTARFEALPIVGQVRHLGMIWAMELVQDRVTREPFNPPNSRGWAICNRAWEEGVWLRPMGSQLYVMPPYCTTREQLRDCFEVLYRNTQKESEAHG